MIWKVLHVIVAEQVRKAGPVLAIRERRGHVRI